MPQKNQKLIELGGRLKEARLKKNETQSVFAARIGISIPTLRKMESGDTTVNIGHWAAALEILDRINDIDSLLATKQSLFDKVDTLFNSKSRLKVRKRARAKR